MKNLDKQSIDLIIADPPYGIAKKKPLKGSSHGDIKTLDAEWDIFNSKEDYLDFSRNWIRNTKQILKPNGSIFVYGSRQSIYEMKNLLDECGFYYLDTITWIKRDAMPNVTCRGYAYSTEFILWYCNSDSGWTFNHQEIKKYNNDKQMRNYWDIQRSMTKQEKTTHPTQKKIELSNIIVEGHSNENDLVYIPFAGSGSEIESCILKNRNWLATETNQEYIDKIITPRINNIK
jgi:site-specific DNA-methyltransferase (adenine-specific)